MNKLQIYNLFKKSNKNFHKPMLVTIEGVDAVGKHSQTMMLKDYLIGLGYKVKTISFPEYDLPIGKVIASYLKGDYGDINSVPHELICIAYAADRARMREEINSYLKDGYIVLSDRYTYSNIFTAAKMEESKRMDFIEWNEDIEFNQLSVIKPDWNFFLYIEPELSIKRIQERGKREYQKGKEDIHENNSNLLIETTKTYLGLINNRSNWTIINQMNGKDQMSKIEVFELLKKEFNKLLD